ncbi:MAG: chemotaxis protein CheW [Cyanobacteria bacterium P01_G01_bin.19]
MQTFSAAAKVQSNLSELFQSKLAPGDAYVKFQLTSGITAFLSMQQVKESLIVDVAQITPLPNMPEFAIGIINSRDRVFCIFDLSLLLKVSTESINSRQQQIIVFQTTGDPGIYVGLAVAQLQGIIRISQEDIQPYVDDADSAITPYISGSIVQEETSIPILSFERILQSLTAKS